jgi:hypothetical protein
MQWRAQSSYFTCPIFEMDPDGSLADTELTDGGLPDAPEGELGSSMPTFSANIQHDVDAMGCAIAGCHDIRTAPGQMHLYFHPSTMDELRANYNAALPFTSGTAQPGGRFVNEVPLPAPMHARWLQWIADGTPF